jgi:deoxycytidine triphosphate deaminase
MNGVLTKEDILEYMGRSSSKKLSISPLLERTQIDNSSVDLRIGQHILVPRSSKLGAVDVVALAFDELSETQMVDCYARVRLTMGNYFTLHSGEQAYISTLEYIGMPDDLQGDVTLRHTFSSAPIMANVAKIKPGFRGVVTLSIINNAPFAIYLYPGMRFAQMELRTLTRSVELSRRSRFLTQTAPPPVQLHKDEDLLRLGPAIEPIIIGIVSTLAAGRTTAITYLQEHHGFAVFRLSDTLKNEALKRGIGTSRRELQDLGNSLREIRGNGFLAQQLRNSPKWLNTRHPYVIVDGFKHPAEVDEFKKQQRFKLIGIDALEAERMRRTFARRRVGEPTNEEQFRELDQIDLGVIGSSNNSRQQVGSILSGLADRDIIMNDGSTDDLNMALDRLVVRIKQLNDW